MKTKELLSKFGDSLQGFKRYLPLLFGILVLATYGFLVYRVQVLNSQEPSEAEAASQGHTAQVLHVDQHVLDQVQALQDNSVNVQTLFNTARSNPFKE